MPAKHLYQPTMQRVRLSSFSLCLSRTVACVHNVHNALSYAIYVGAVPGGLFCGELGADAGRVATMQESYQLGQWIDGM